jgi:hypothetical protein
MSIVLTPSSLANCYFCCLQLVRSNSRRFIPSQADEEIHQLSYLQKHMANILTLLADSVEGEGDDSLVCHLPLSSSNCFYALFFICGIV